MRFSWTPETIAIFTRMWREEKSIAEIAACLGTSYDSIESKRRRLKLAPKLAMPRPAITTLSLHAPTRDAHTCKWPIGHPHEKGFRFCGEKSEGMRPYCPEHLGVAYQRSKPRLKSA